MHTVKKTVAAFFAVLMFVTPLMAQEAETEAVKNAAPAQTAPAPAPTAVGGSYDNPTADAQNDAMEDVNGTTWFVIGCLLGLIGWLIAYVSQPNPPATRLLGKSSDYVAVYTDAYRQKAKEIQTSKALTGCLIGTLATVLIQVILIASAN